MIRELKFLVEGVVGVHLGAKNKLDKLKAKGLFLFAMFSPSGLTTEVLSRLTIQPSRWLRRTRVCSFLGREAFVTTPLF